MIEELTKLKELISKRKAFEGHKGRPGKVGGSLPKGAVGATVAEDAKVDAFNFDNKALKLLNAMPDVKNSTTFASKIKLLHKNGITDLYDNDPDMKFAMDVVSLYTQGLFSQYRDAADGILSGWKEWAKKEASSRSFTGDNSFQELFLAERKRLDEENDEFYIGDPKRKRYEQIQHEAIVAALSKWNPPADWDPADQFLSVIGGMYDQKNIKGEQMHGSLIVRDAMKGAVVLNSLIRQSKPATEPIYRGLSVDKSYVREITDKFVVGSVVDIVGAASFTDDRAIAYKFAEGKAGGARLSASEQRRNRPVMITIQSGAKAIDVNPISVWKQGEWLTSGKFKVIDVQDNYQVDIILEQIDVPELKMPEDVS